MGNCFFIGHRETPDRVYPTLLETIERHGRLSRAELNDLWLASDISGGEPRARRPIIN